MKRIRLPDPKLRLGTRFRPQLNVVEYLKWDSQVTPPRKLTHMSDIVDDLGLTAAEPVACCVCNQAGVYYAQLYVPGHLEPMRVALHGVTSDLQAAQALESFARLRGCEPQPVAALAVTTQ